MNKRWWWKQRQQLGFSKGRCIPAADESAVTLDTSALNDLIRMRLYTEPHIYLWAHIQIIYPVFLFSSSVSDWIDEEKDREPEY